MPLIGHGGSTQALSGLAPALVEAGRIVHIASLPRRLGRRMSGLYDSFWKAVGGTGCVEVIQVNHCLSLAKSAGFRWLIYIRGVDKFLHSDTEDRAPGFLVRFVDSFPNDTELLVRRRDCGGRELDTEFGVAD